MLLSDSATIAPTELFKAGMRRLPQSISIVTTAHEGRYFGFAAGSVASVALEPPTILISIARAGSTHDALIASGQFCLNVVGAADREIVEHFTVPEQRARRFTAGTWTLLPNQSPVLTSAEAVFDCDVVKTIGYHSHTLVLGVVRAVLVSEAPSDPLIYVERSFRRLAPGG